MRNLFKKTMIIPAVILPFLFLTLSLCCFKMPGAHAMADCCSSMASSDTIQKGMNFSGVNSHPSKCQCEQLTESYEKAKLKSVGSQHTIFNHPKAIFLSQNPKNFGLTAVSFFNYQSPPKVAQNSLPLYLQISVFRI